MPQCVIEFRHSANVPPDREQRDNAVVIVVSEPPQAASGGPLGLCHQLLEALASSRRLENAALYCLSVAEPKCHRIRSAEDMQRIAQPVSERMSGFSRLRARALSLERGRFRMQRNAVHLLRTAVESMQIRRLRPIVGTLTASHKAVVFHAHTMVVAYKIVRALGGDPGQQSRLLITDHTKGGALSEYLELLGPSAAGDRNYGLVSSQTRVAVEAAEVVAFPSQGARQLWQEKNTELAGIVRSKSAVLYNGVSLPRVAYGLIPSCSATRLFAIAQHVPEKGLERLLRVVAELRNLVPGRPISLRVAGGFTRITPALEDLRARLGLENEVAFLGRVGHESVLEELSNADIFVAFPRVVVFDLSLLEAMAMAKPIVTNALGGNVEALGKTYPLFADDEETFARAIAQCGADAALRMRAAQRNKRRYERLFTSDAMARRHWDLYSALFFRSCR